VYDVPGLESLSVVVDADADRAIICGAVSDRGGGVDGGSSSASSSSSEEAATTGGRETEQVLEWASVAGRGLVVRRDVRLSGDDDCDSSTST